MDKPYHAHHTLFSSGLMMAQSYCDAVTDGSKMATSAREVSINHIDLCNFMNTHNPRYIDILSILSYRLSLCLIAIWRKIKYR